MAEETTQEKKNKKVNKMTMEELDAALKKSIETMNGESSKYILALKARKEELLAAQSK